MLTPTKHFFQLSLAIPPWVGATSTSQRVVMLCGWGVKAGMVRVWVTGKTMLSPCYHGPYLSALEMRSMIKRYTNRRYFTLEYNKICKVTHRYHCDANTH